MSERLFVIASGGHAKVVVESVLARTPGREIIILDDDPEAAERRIFDIGVAGDRECLASAEGAPVVVAIGDNGTRHAFIDWLAQRDYPLETVVHPAAIVALSVSLGAGAFVGAGAVVIGEARIGRAAIINTGATVDHDCDVGDAAHIAPGAHLSGNVRVGDRALIGVGASVCPGISICHDAIVGAGAVVVTDITTAGTFVGSPARRLR